MSKDTTEVIAEFDPTAWNPDRDTDTGEEIFSESDAIEAAVRTLNRQGIEIRSIWHAHDIAIEYRGKREYISLGILQGSAEQAMMEAMREISCAIDAQEHTECYLSQMLGKINFHIRSKPPRED